MKLSPIDIVLLLIIAGYAITGLRRGFLMTVAHTFGNIVAFLGAFYGAKVLCVPVANAVILPLMKGKLNEAAAGALKIGSNASAPSAEQIWNGLSSSMQQLLGQFGQHKEALLSGGNPMEKLVAALSANMAQSISFTLLFVVLFIAISIVMILLFKTVDFISNIVLLGPLNALAGGVLGAACGFLICCCTLWALQTFAPAMFSEVGILSPSKIQQTIVAKKMMEIKPDIFLFKNGFSGITYGKL